MWEYPDTSTASNTTFTASMRFESCSRVCNYQNVMECEKFQREPLLDESKEYDHNSLLREVQCSKREEWLLSSTITEHVSGTLDHVYDLHQAHQANDNGSSMTQIGKLEALIQESDDNATVARATLDVRVVPGSRNLISLSRLLSSGQVTFLSNGNVQFGSHTVAKCTNGVFKMTISRAPPFSSPPVPRILFSWHTDAVDRSGCGLPVSTPRSVVPIGGFKSSYGSLTVSTSPEKTLNVPQHHEANNYQDWQSLFNTRVLASSNKPKIGHRQPVPPLVIPSLAPSPPISADTASGGYPKIHTWDPTSSGTISTDQPCFASSRTIEKPPSPDYSPIGRKPDLVFIPENPIMHLHNRLAHIDLEQVRELVENGNRAAKLEHKPEAEVSCCGACKKARQELTAVKIGDPGVSEVALKSNQPLELIHASLCGPLIKRGLCGAKYFLVIVDDFSRYTFVLPVGSPAEVGFRLVDFIECVEGLFGPTGCKVMGLKVTQECRNRRLVDFCKASDVLHLQTVPNKPQMKGVAERMKRSLLEASTAMRIVSDAPMCFWDEAIRLAADIRNRCPNKATTHVPLERFMSKFSRTDTSFAGSQATMTSNSQSSLKVLLSSIGTFGNDIQFGLHKGVWLGCNFNSDGKSRVFQLSNEDEKLMHIDKAVPMIEDFSVISEYRAFFEAYELNYWMPALTPRPSMADIMPKRIS